MKKFFNKKILIFFSLIIGIGIIIDYSLFKPSEINFFIANRFYGSPANSAFTDENFYKCVVDAYNSKNNTNLPYTTNLTDEQLASITYLSCDGMNKSDEQKIKNTNGLNKLISLGFLNIANNQLSNLDVSHNLSLIILYASENQLSNLDVSHNSLLEELYISNNQLTSLDVSHNTLLTKLNTDYNQITSLDMIHNPSLTYLKASCNQLTSLDVRNNDILEFLDVSYNQLKNIDVSHNTTLKYLYADENKLTSLDVIFNTSLIDLIVDRNQLTNLDVSHNTILETLILSHNQLTNIDVSKNIELTRLDIDFNQLTNMDVSHNPKLISFYSDNNQLTSLDVSQNQKLGLLYANNNQLTSLDLSNNVILEILDVSYNQLTNIDVSKNIELTRLGVTYNELTNIDVSHNTLLTELYVSATKLTSLDVSENTALTILDVGANKLTNIDVSHNTSLTELYVGANKLTNIDVSHNPSLTKLYTEYNQLTGLDVSQNPSLEYLYASANQLTSLNVSGATSLAVLDVSFNELTNIDVSKNLLLESFDINNQRRYVYMYDNDFSNINDSKLLDLVKQNGEDKDTYSFTINYNYKGNVRSFIFDYKIKRVKMLSDQYLISDIPNSYIYTGIDLNDEKIFNNINLTDMKNFVGKVENNKYIIKHNNDAIKEFDLININSDKYDLTKKYIFTFDENILSNINVLNGDKVIKDNKLQIKKGEDILQEFDLVNATSGKYDLALDKVKVQDINIESLISNIDCTNCSVKVKNNDIYKINGDFTDGDSLVIMYNDEIIKEYELSYVVSGVSLNNNDLKLNLDKKKTFKLEATVLPTTAENKNITWESNNPSVASVDNNGNVTAHSLGNAIITAKTEEGEFTAECNVSVVEISTYTVTYPDNSTEEYEENERITFKSDLTKQGYKLVGYKCNDKDYKLTDELLMPDHDITIEAIWELVIPNVTNNDKYVVEDNYFKNINLNTNITNLDLGLDDIYTVKITKDNQEKTSGLVGTGDVINIYLGDTLVTNYTVIIKGDVTGNGKVLIGDVSRAYQYLKKKISMDDCFVKAADVGQVDGVIKVGDISKLYQYLKGKIKNL